MEHKDTHEIKRRDNKQLWAQIKISHLEKKEAALQRLFRERSKCVVHYSFAVQEKAKEFVLYSVAVINRINGQAAEVPYCFLSYC